MVGCKPCGKYAAGSLQSKISIERKTTTDDDMGGVIDAWAVAGTPWAAWKARGGSEIYAAQRINPRVTVVAAIRFRGNSDGAPYYTAGDRVSYRGREYAIAAVIDPDDRQEWLELHLMEGAPS